MVIDASLTNTMPFKTTKKNTTLGNKIYKSTDREIQHITRHSREFCNILASAAEYSWNLLGYRDGWDLVIRAMKHGDMRNI